MYICVLSSTTTCVLTYVLKIWIFLLLYPFCIFYKLWFDYIVPEHSNASAWLYKAVAGLAGALASFQCVGHSTMDLDESWIMNVCAHVGGVLFRLCTCIYIDSLGRWAQAPLYIYPSRISLLLLHYRHTERNWVPVDPTNPDIIMQGQRRRVGAVELPVAYMKPHSLPRRYALGPRRLSPLKLQRFTDLSCAAKFKYA
jgi:hypothetical protein